MLHVRFSLIGLCLGAVLALVALWWLDPSPPARADHVACRPSHPARALADETRPAVLFWGNSLLFDPSWDHPDFAAVICARQGLTVAAALPLTGGLPAFAPDVVLLGFGSVELIRPDPVDPDLWRSDLNQMLMVLRKRYPDAQVLVATIPAGQQADAPWVYADRPELAAMNRILTTMPGTGVLDLSALFDNAGITAQHYDGVHLSPDSYRVWAAALAAHLGQ